MIWRRTSFGEPSQAGSEFVSRILTLGDIPESTAAKSVGLSNRSDACQAIRFICSIPITRYSDGHWNSYGCVILWDGYKERGIRISGPPLGRPPKNVSKETKKQALEDERFRNAIEGKFGQAKRLMSLNCIMTAREALGQRASLIAVLTKLSETSETSIAITFLVINLSTQLLQVYCLFLSLFLYPSKLDCIFDSFIVKLNIKAYFKTEKLIFQISWLLSNFSMTFSANPTYRFDLL